MKTGKFAWARWVLLFLAALLFGWLLLSVVGGIVNAINLLGMTACAAVMLGCIFFQPLKRLVLRLWSHLAWRIALVTLAALVSAGVLLLLIAAGMIVSGMNQHADDCDTLIVLGCQVHGQTPSRLLGYRIDTAYEYLCRNPQAVCVVSGGQGSGEDISEAECMYRSLCARGVEPSRIYLEDTSRNTIENLRNSKALIEREGLSENAAIVTNSFHMYRAQHIAAKFELPCKGVCARTGFAYMGVYTCREAVAMVYYILFGIKSASD